MADKLALRAETEEDLKVISSLLQDAVFKVSDIAWQPSAGRLAAIGNRYRWEEKKRWFRRMPTRVRTAFHFSSVLKAEITGIDLAAGDIVLNLLTIKHSVNALDDLNITLTFSGGASIRLTAEAIDMVMSDVSDTWEALGEPKHR